MLLLPAFFALTGMRTEVGLLRGWQDWLICGGDHPGGDGRQVRRHGRSPPGWPGTTGGRRPPSGRLMNTRGLMGLIVLDIGLGLGVITPRLFAMMVLMALATTLVTAPLLRRLVPHSGAGDVP